ncbi:MAG: hypothetical protein ACJ74O_02310 [Frankiaceae bacterium]
MGDAIAFPSGLPVLPAPASGEVLLDPRGEGRAMRVTRHAESEIVVVSLWRGERCIGSHRLHPADVGRLVQALVDGLVGTEPAGAPATG